MYCNITSRWLTVQTHGPKIWNFLPAQLILELFPHSSLSKLELKNTFYTELDIAILFNAYLLYNSVFFNYCNVFPLIFFALNVRSLYDRVYDLFISTKKDQDFTSIASLDPFCTRYSLKIRLS